jgi:NAD(P)H-dependent FMN reductase
VFVTNEYNWGMQPGLKTLTDHFLEAWFWRPAAIASYSAGRIAGARVAAGWRGTLSEMGMIVTSSTLSVGGIAQKLDASKAGLYTRSKGRDISKHLRMRASSLRGRRSLLDQNQKTGALIWIPKKH